MQIKKKAANLEGNFKIEIFEDIQRKCLWGEKSNCSFSESVKKEIKRKGGEEV